ncbi:MAG: hypothetical protein HN509_14910 [Halobacteriovoraceae bacterium]|jgi:hypothetical protein|nr:hypothetical protein [Halobacteriovoraceae bacterium]MBT5094946.1 hypothetical protein [Halobacteriovoraceae bacterium]
MTKAISTYLFLSAFLFMGALATKAKDPQEVILANLKYLQVNSVSDLPKAYKIIEKSVPYIGKKGNPGINKGIIRLYTKIFKVTSTHQHLEPIIESYLKNKDFFKQIIDTTIKSKKDRSEFYFRLKTMEKEWSSGNG